MAPSSLDALLDRLTMRVPTGWDLGLERTVALLEKLGNPHKKLPPVIHVAGTNGKGSVTATSRAILEAAGHSVHVFTSPHLVHFNERVRIGRKGGGVLVDDEDYARAILEAERAVGDGRITFFELSTVAAFMLYAEMPADFAVIEVGLGGRLDSTNVIPPPLASVITTISIDHEHFLGNTLTEIAGEKAGIIKRGSVTVASPQHDDVVAVLEKKAAREGVRLHLGGQDWTAGPEDGRLVFRDEAGLLDLPPPKLLGRHQFTNAGTAIAALRAAGIAPDEATIEKGLMSVDWPARMQRLPEGPLTAHAPEGAEVWLDGGHNPGAGAVVAEYLGELHRKSPRPLYLVAGMLETKDPVGFFRPFAGLAERVITVPIEGGHKARTPESLAGSAREAGLVAEPAPDFAAALDRVKAETRAKGGEPPRILMCGSLYLAGEILKANNTIPT
jgi:dihydrofolate synthase/folylpolyglutamate synthase